MKVDSKSTDILNNATDAFNNGQNKCPKKYDSLKYACIEGKLDLAKWLVSIGVDIYYLTPGDFLKLCMNGHFETAKWICSLRSDIIGENQVITYCSKLGEIAISKWLVSMGASVNHVLMNSCECGHFELAKWD